MIEDNEMKLLLMFFGVVGFLVGLAIGAVVLLLTVIF